MRPRKKNVSRERLKKSWHPVWVDSCVPASGRMTSTYQELCEMSEWCEMNCANDWTEMWMMEDLGFWFKSQDDAFLFKLTWLR